MLNIIHTIFLIWPNSARNHFSQAVSKAQRKASMEQDLATEAEGAIKTRAMIKDAESDQTGPWWSAAEFPDAQTRVEQARLTTMKPSI